MGCLGRKRDWVQFRNHSVTSFPSPELGQSVADARGRGGADVALVLWIIDRAQRGADPPLGVRDAGRGT